MSIFGSREEQASSSASDVDEHAAIEAADSDAGNITVDSVSEDEGILDNDDDLDRPRYAGSQNQWRSLTRLDRQVAQAQEKLEDEDLSIHLYNAHILKTRTRRPASDLPGVKSWQSKDRWRRPEEWVPNRHWTAWPLEEEAVPRSGTTHVNGSLALHHPAQELEQCIMACITSRARQEMQEDCTFEPRPTESATDSDATLTQTVHPSSQSEAEHETSTKRRYEALQSPVPLADDEKAWQLLHPAVRRAMSSLDRLFASLHRARQNRHGGASDSEAEAETGGSGTEDSLPSQSRPRKTSLKRRRSANDTRAHQSRVVARDWSEVLGHAAYSGWNEKVMERTVARCSELFAERMDVRTSAAPSRSDSLELASHGRSSPTANRRDWFCPEEDCKRHMQPFRLRRSLLSHTLKDHGYTIPWVGQDDTVQPSTSDSSAEEDQVPSELDSAYDRMHNGIHLDGFLQPITLRPEWIAAGKSKTAKK